MFIIDFRNKLVSDYRFSVIGNSNVDKVDLVSHFIQYANYSIYLKVMSDDERYVDKIAIASEDISVDEDVLVCRWTMGAVSTQCKKLYLQLQFEQGDTIIAQSRIVSVILGDTINVDELLPVIYPQVLKELQNQIDTLKIKSFALASMSYLNDVLYLSFENAMHEIVSSVQVAIPTSDKMLFIEGADYKTLAELYTLTQGKPFIHEGISILKVSQSGSNYNVMLWTTSGYGVEENQNGSAQLGDLAFANFNYYLLGTSEHNKIYGTDNNGNQTLLDVDHGSNYGGKVVRRDSNDQIYVPLIPTANGQATSKKYVDDKIEEIKDLSYQEVNITEYPTLNDFLASTGEKGYLYLYPIDTSEAPDFESGYYRYVWENNAWKSLGTTEIDLTNYYDKDHDVIPNSNNAKDLGSSSYTWKDLYLSGSLKLGGTDTGFTANEYGNISVKRNGDINYYFTSSFYPNGNNLRDLGTSSNKWKDFYLAGKMYGANYNVEIDNLYRFIYGTYSTGSSQLTYEYITEKDLSADTTFTLATAPSQCHPEYKAIITNSGNSTITLTFTGVSSILCNNENCVITNGTNSTLTLPSGTTIECSILNGKMVAIDFDYVG